MKSIFAENIIKARKHFSWVQEDVAVRIGIKRSTYASYEEGRATPPPEALLMLFKIFEITDIDSFVLDENFEMKERSKENGKQNGSLLEKQYSKLKGKDKVAVNALLEI